jgi:predicted metal-binding membrane protein
MSVVLVLLTALSWLYMFAPGEVAVGSERLMPCCGARFDVAFSMWVVMMAGMMIPSAAPMVLTYAAIMRKREARGAPFIPSGLFLVGYLLAWTAFSLVAAFAQWLLFRLALLDRHALSVGPWAGAAILLVAGVFQLSTAKGACLTHCRAPVGYFMTEWTEGRAGAVVMGLKHGVFCVGCCWALMVVLFAVGIMNILWGVVITAFVIAEKVLPWQRAIVRFGTALCFVGAGVLVYRAVLST